MKARKTRKPSEAELKAYAKRGGLTRRAFNASKRKPEAPRRGAFQVVALFDGNPVPQTADFPNEAAALARFDRLASSPNLKNIKVVEFRTMVDDKGNVTSKQQLALFSFTKLGQVFANSKFETLYQRKGGNGPVLTLKALRDMDADPAAYEVYKQVAYDGSPWWERRA